jgi:hypothetical protein
MPPIKIEYTGEGKGYQTKVTNLKTGELIPISQVYISIDTDLIPTAVLVIRNPVLDLTLHDVFTADEESPDQQQLKEAIE